MKWPDILLLQYGSGRGAQKLQERMGFWMNVLFVSGKMSESTTAWILLSPYLMFCVCFEFWMVACTIVGYMCVALFIVSFLSTSSLLQSLSIGAGIADKWCWSPLCWSLQLLNQIWDLRGIKRKRGHSSTLNLSASKACESTVIFLLGCRR